MEPTSTSYLSSNTNSRPAADAARPDCDELLPSTKVAEVAEVALAPSDLSAEIPPIERGRISKFYHKHKELLAVSLIVAALALVVISIFAMALGGIPGIVTGAVVIGIGVPALLIAAGHIILSSPDSESPQIRAKRQEENLYMQAVRAEFDIHEAGGGGNCLFHSLRYHFGDLTGLRDHAAVREAVVKHMTDNAADYRHFMEDDVTIEKYLKKMAKKRVWGGDQEVSAFADYLRVNGHNVQIVVHDPTKGGSLSYPSVVEGEPQRFHLLRKGYHWQPLTSKRRAESPADSR